MCALEGASLFYPEDDNEAHAVLSFWNNTQPFWSVHVGISDLIVKGVFETIHGKNTYNIMLLVIIVRILQSDVRVQGSLHNLFYQNYLYRTSEYERNRDIYDV